MQRRSFVAAAALTAAALSEVSAQTMGGKSADAISRNFVLVHGAFHGGWCWQAVARRLSAQGHRVFTPTFTGLGERTHLLHPGVDLNTFVKDVSSVLETEELRDVVLVGHSFGGYVITGVADLMPERISQLIYLDAAVAISGRSIFSELPPEVRSARMKAAVELNGTRVILPPAARTFGLENPDDIAWVERRMSPMPLASYDSTITLKSAPGSGVASKRYIRCIRPAIPQVAAGADYARAQGWGYSELATGHDAIVTAPQELTAKLLQL